MSCSDLVTDDLRERARRQPDAVLDEAHRLLEMPGQLPDVEVLAWHAITLAHTELGDVLAARRALREAMAIAGRAGLSERSAELLLTQAWLDLDTGDHVASTTALRTATPLLAGHELARARCLRGLALCRKGKWKLAISTLDGAVPELLRHRDKWWLANALVGRGIAHGYALRPQAAEADLATAGALWDELGAGQRAAACLHNRGFAAMRAGDLATAIARYEEAECRGLDLAAHPEGLIDRAEAMLAAGLVDSARPILRRAITLLITAGRDAMAAEARLSLARCSLRSGDFDVAIAEAILAARAFRRQGRKSWVPLAVAVELRARWSTGQHGPLLLGRATHCVSSCLRHGWVSEAVQLDLAAARSALSISDEARANRFQEHAAITVARQGGDGAARLRASTQLAEEVAATVLQAILPSARAEVILRWTERYRAAVLRRPQVRPSNDAKPAECPRLDEVYAALGDRVMLTLFHNEIDLYALSIMDGQVELRRAGSAAQVDAEVSRLRFAYQTGIRGGWERTGIASSVARELNRLLLAPLLAAIGDRPLVVVPAGSLHGLPWAALPGLRDRPVSVAPSVLSWLRATVARPTVGDRAVWVAGPGLRYADQEVLALHRRYGGHLLRSTEATGAAVMSMMDGADTVHIAAHCRFRRDQPLFSWLQLVDGPLHAYDLDRLRRAPRLVVLSACEAGLSGDDLMGLAATLLARGSSTVIASVLPVADVRMLPFMETLYASMRAGLGPAAALASAQARHGELGFVCLGCG